MAMDRAHEQSVLSFGICAASCAQGFRWLQARMLAWSTVGSDWVPQEELVGWVPMEQELLQLLNLIATNVVS
jgi:hypothetical protein